jgi:asparagine synthase (glutamine-hydrolysing)
MCGIVGIVTAERGAYEDDIVRMRDSMTHRGPDDAGHWVSPDKRVALGHRRLSIIDLSPLGHQPMANEDGTIRLVFNGEIYNFQQLRRELISAGHQFRSATDTEVILHGYEEWGERCVDRLRGMFALAIWDERRQELFLARDRFGIKPLFYREHEGLLTFASELKALVNPRERRPALDETALYDFFTYRYIPTPKTVYRDIRKLPAGHCAWVKDGRIAVRQYWDVPMTPTLKVTETEAVHLVRDKLQEAVNLHMIADVPVGVMLSGGLDSSTLTALASASNAAERLKTFSIAFDVDTHDERPFARMVAERYRTDHKELMVRKHMAMAAERDLVSIYDEPFGDGSAIPCLYVSELARRDIKVVLSGEGGDEVFGGYGWYSRATRRWRSAAVPMWARRLAFGTPARLLPSGFKGQWTLTMASLDPLEWHASMIGTFLRPKKKRLLAPRFFKQFDGYDDYWHFRRYWRDDLDEFSRMQYLDLKTYMLDDVLTKIDRASMALSIEARVPFLDHELVELVFSLPQATRNKNDEQKRLLKLAVEDALPAPILSRDKKGFSMPLNAWFGRMDPRDLPPIDETFFNRDTITRPGAIDGDDLWAVMIVNRWLSGGTTVAGDPVVERRLSGWTPPQTQPIV